MPSKKLQRLHKALDAISKIVEAKLANLSSADADEKRAKIHKIASRVRHARGT